MTQFSDFLAIDRWLSDNVQYQIIGNTLYSCTWRGFPTSCALR